MHISQVAEARNLAGIELAVFRIDELRDENSLVGWYTNCFHEFIRRIRFFFHIIFEGLHAQ